MKRIGIMQGRLIPPINNQIQCFPRDNWAKEFALADRAHLDCIEWIYDLSGADVNPLANDAGIDEIKALSKKHSIGVFSVCADYFMDKPLVRATATELDERLQTLFWLMERCQLLGIERLVLPFVNASRIDNNIEFDSVVSVLTQTLPVVQATGVEIHLETSLSPDRFTELVSRLPHPKLKINYDSGNSASLGYHPRDEFAAYGTRVGSVHIKDRTLRGGTVKLGTGDTDFPALFDNLRTIEYSGDFILQVARDAPGNEVVWAQQNREFVLKHWSIIKSD